ncbi:hypothetical protein AA103196_3112 [Ameyamaea chiangmaiensis NBRC 103196]|nr:hypothetical protein [Ameyamaea chiangmaiensis]MBS4074598.1 hypothetical protein [Ameyamaea chiangmaiensis]GBQ72623.1 hypothetical protein AA103196_3112 [Ameyamaea chiangmaiensis NBRC 103196]
MVVEGHTIDSETVARFAELMRAYPPNTFTYPEVVRLALSAGVPHEAAHRFADRMLQRMKRNGFISCARSSKVWRRVATIPNEWLQVQA